MLLYVLACTHHKKCNYVENIHNTLMPREYYQLGTKIKQNPHTNTDTYLMKVL